MDSFYVVAREPGQEQPDLPTWANRNADDITFDPVVAGTRREDIPDLPGAFILEDVLSANECEQFLRITESMGFHLDAPVSLPHSVRHNTNVNWIVHSEIERTIWERWAGGRPLPDG